MISFIETLKRHRYYAPQVVYHKPFPPQTGDFSRPGKGFPPALARALEKMGVRRLYSHQVAAIENVRGGKNVVIATPTASGKTLTYNLPVVERLLQSPEGKALYLFPLKALEQDQRKAFQEFVQPLQAQFPLKAEIYDGDTASYRRKKIRESVPPVLITNPDMVHLSLLPFHAQWETFFRNLRFVVIDELHTYKGIFGSHLAQVLRRLERVCDFYGATPQIVACSATIANQGLSQKS